MKKILIIMMACIAVSFLPGCRSYDIEEETIKFAKDGKTPVEKTTKKNKSSGWWFFSGAPGKEFLNFHFAGIGK